MEALRLNLLGPLQIFLEGRRLHALRSSRAQGLLVYLAVERRQPHGREAIGKLIWPGIPLASARSNLRQTVYQVRQAIPEVLTSAGRREPLIVADRQTIRINSGALLRLDVELLRQIHGATDPEPERLEEAAALYRGDFLVDQTLIEGDQFQTWVREQRELYRHLMAEIAGRAARRLLAREELDRAQAQARQVLELEPLNEPAHGLLMRILARRGQRVAALRLFQEYQDALQRELGIAPAAEITALFRQLAAESEPGAAAASDSLLGTASVERARHPIAPPPPAMVERSPVRQPASFDVPHNLPVASTSFIGREKEVKQIAELLERARLVTLTGVGGCGKTRLALEAARLTRNNFSGGVWLVELASVADPEQVVKSVAGALPVAQRDQLDPLRVVFDFLEERHALLLLDNCEHLLDAVAALTMSLLRAAPGVRILATSRESLGVPGELPFVVSPLDTIDPDRLPPLGVLRRIEAIRLFVERAGALRPDFALTEASAGAVARICRRLDGIPLAIELAAARIRVLAVEQILERLAQRFQLLTGGSPLAPPRQQTLRATIEWSYRLLDEQERRLVRRLAVFSGGWTMAAAERVCAGEGIATGDVLDLLSHLVDKSWVVTVATNKEIRFRQLETIRMYALERFLESDEVADVRNRHLASFVAWAEKLRPEYFREEWYEARAEAERELENVRGALSWSLESGDAEAGMRLAVALFDIWDTGRQEEGRRWLERGLEHRTALPARLLSDTLDRAGFLAARLDDFATALARFGESVVVAQDVGDHRRRARSVLNLAIVHSWCGRFEVAERHWLEARELFARVGDERGIMDTFQISGTCFLLQRDFMRSRAAYSQAMKMARKMGNKRAVDHLCGGLGFAEVHMGHVETAKALFRQGMQGGGQLVHAFLGLAMVAAREGRFVRAGHLIGMLDRLQASPVQHALPQKAAAVSGAVARTIADIRARGDKRVFDAARAEGRRVTLQRAIAYALEEVEGGTFRVVP